MKKNITTGIKKNAIDKRQVMTLAWVEARAWEQKRGGHAWQYIGYCLRWAWAFLKSAQRMNQIIDGLDKISGSNHQINELIAQSNGRPVVKNGRTYKRVGLHDFLRAALTGRSNVKWRRDHGVSDLVEGRRLYDLYERIFLLYKIDWYEIPDGLVSGM